MKKLLMHHNCSCVMRRQTQILRSTTIPGNHRHSTVKPYLADTLQQQIPFMEGTVSKVLNVSPCINKRNPRTADTPALFLSLSQRTKIPIAREDNDHVVRISATSGNYPLFILLQCHSFEIMNIPYYVGYMHPRESVRRLLMNLAHPACHGDVYKNACVVYVIRYAYSLLA